MGPSASPGVFRRRPASPARRRQRRGRTLATRAATALAAGTASFVSSGPGGIAVTATDATGGTPPYAYQWQRQVNGGSFSTLSNGGGVSGADTLAVTDGSATAGNLYGYRLLYQDSVPSSVTSNTASAQLYSGGALSGGGGIFGGVVVR